MKILLCIICLLFSVLPAVGNRNYTNGSLNNQTTYGEYWSSTQQSSPYGYNWEFNSGNSYLNNNDKAFGFSVRCVKKYEIKELRVENGELRVNNWAVNNAHFSPHLLVTRHYPGRSW